MIEFKGVRMGYATAEGRVDILEDASFHVTEGETVAIVGPSGSGKTTLLLLLSGLERPEQGQIKLDGQNLADLSSDSLADWRRDHMGIIFQSFHLLPGLSALGNVQVPLEIASAANSGSRSREMLDAVGLSHRVDHFPRQLSGGEQQRVAIARALVHQPRLILGDEPTGNLDRQSGKRVLDLLFELNEQACSTLILVTHDDQVAKRCQRVLRLQDGQLKED